MPNYDLFFPIPKRIFLDTNVVNLILDHGEYIFDNCQLSVKLNPRVKREVEALGGIFDTGQRACWELAVSIRTFEEVSSTRNSSRRESLLSWFAELSYCWESRFDNEEFTHAFQRNRIKAEKDFLQFLTILPDNSDRHLILDAIAYECDCFCTFDYKTILLQRDHLSELPIQIVTPSEWWKKIFPWKELWL